MPASSTRRHGATAGLSIALLATAPLLAAQADVIKARTTGYKELGGAYKAVNDAVRSGNVQPAQMQQASARIIAAARNQYRYFPAGSGPQPGVKTAARPEIWTDPKGFRTAQDVFARQAIAFQRVAASNDAALIRAESRKLGATCKGCHDHYRAQDD